MVILNVNPTRVDDAVESVQFDGKTMFDARDGNLTVTVTTQPGFVDNDEERTLNLTFDRSHFMLLERDNQKPPATKKTTIGRKNVGGKISNKPSGPKKRGQKKGPQKKKPAPKRK